jgi:hypothetical protein
MQEDKNMTSENKEYCCDNMEILINSFKCKHISTGEGEISGSVSVDITGVDISDGWTNLPKIVFNFCPYCGEAQILPLLKRHIDEYFK